VAFGLAIGGLIVVTGCATAGLDRVGQDIQNSAARRTEQTVRGTAESHMNDIQSTVQRCLTSPLACARNVGTSPTKHVSSPPELPRGSGEAVWYVEIGGQPQGPLPINSVRQLIARGVVDEEALVWKEGMQAWEPAGRIAELGSAARPVPPSLPGR
jgi:hypothetical protein